MTLLIVVGLVGFWLGTMFGMLVMAALSAGSDADDRAGLL